MANESLEPHANVFIRIWKAMIGKLNNRIEEAYLRRQANLTGWRPAEPDPDVAADRRPDSAPASKADTADRVLEN